MAYMISLPNGDTAEFPDSMTTDQISQVLRAKFPSSASKPSLLARAANVADEFVNNPFENDILKPAESMSAGFTQGLANIAPGIANLGIHAANGVTGSDIKPFKAFNFAPDDINANAGELGSYLVGGGIPKLLGKAADLSGIAKGAEGLSDLAMQNPSIANAVSKAQTLLSKYPRAAGLAGTAATGAAQGAVYNPNDQTLGAVLGAGGNLLGPGTTSVSPYIAATARAALGGIIGYGVDPSLVGAISGASAGIAAPKFAEKVGLTKKPVSMDFLDDVPQEDIQGRYDANQRLGTRADIGEVSGNPVTGSKIGNVLNSSEGAQDMTKAALEKRDEQKGAISNLLNTVSQSDRIAAEPVRQAARDAIAEAEKSRLDATNPLYAKAHKDIVDSDRVNQLLAHDKTISNAVTAALSDPAYSVELDGYAPNSIKVLDYAKRKIDQEIEQAKNFNDNDRVRVLNDSKSRLVDATDSFSPKFAKARALYNELSPAIDDLKNSRVGKIANTSDVNLKNIASSIFDPNQTDIGVLRNVKNHIQSQDPQAWDDLVKNQLSALTKGKSSAADFYKNMLSNNNLFNQMKAAVEDNPQASQMLDDMKTGWEFMTKPDVGKNNRFLASKNLDKPRSTAAQWMQSLKDFIADKNTKEKAAFLNSPDWINEYDNVRNYKTMAERKKAFSQLIAKSIGNVTGKLIPATFTAINQPSSNDSEQTYGLAGGQ